MTTRIRVNGQEAILNLQTFQWESTSTILAQYLNTVQIVPPAYKGDYAHAAIEELQKVVSSLEIISIDPVNQTEHIY
jgi:hypothetical protein